MKIKDLNGEMIKGSLYLSEIQLITEDDIYDIESVLDRRTVKSGGEKVEEV